MIRASGARGSGFDPRSGPHIFYSTFSVSLWQQKRIEIFFDISPIIKKDQNNLGNQEIILDMTNIDTI